MAGLLFVFCRLQTCGRGSDGLSVAGRAVKHQHDNQIYATNTGLCINDVGKQTTFPFRSQEHKHKMEQRVRGGYRAHLRDFDASALGAFELPAMVKTLDVALLRNLYTS